MGYLLLIKEIIIMSMSDSVILGGSNSLPLGVIQGVDSKELVTGFFRDGESSVKVVPGELSGRSVFINQGTGKSEIKSINENVMELYLTARTVNRSAPESITAVVPYFSYARQDHTVTDGEALSLDDIGAMLQIGGVTRIVSVDLHSEALREFMPETEIVNLSSAGIFSNYLSGIGLHNPAIIAPDAGAQGRNYLLKELLADQGVETPDVVHCRKIRRQAGEVESLSVMPTSSGVALDLKGRDIVVFDDICDSAGTLMKVVDKIKTLGARNVYACITHPVFSDPAYDRISSSDVRMIVTDTIGLDERFTALPTVTQLSVAGLVKEAVSRIALGETLEGLTMTL